jgi:hypothetical protein
MVTMRVPAWATGFEPNPDWVIQREPMGRGSESWAFERDLIPVLMDHFSIGFSPEWDSVPSEKAAMRTVFRRLERLATPEELAAYRAMQMAYRPAV